MDESFYVQFLAEQASGRKEEAKIAIRRFVESFNGLEERETWTRKFLSTHKPGTVVRHELYAEVIFPVLFAGYGKRDPWSLYWLAETEQNLAKAAHLAERISSSPQQLLLDAHAIAPASDEIGRGLLRSLLHGFEYIAHEWPSGLLYHVDKPRETQYWELLAEIRLARKLDTSGAHTQQLAEFEQIVVADARRKKR